MDTLIKKKKRFPWPAVIVPSIVIISLATFLLSTSLYEQNTLLFKYGLDGYRLSDIKGEPAYIVCEDYSFSNLSEVFFEEGSILPEAIASGDVYYFAYYEKVKHNYNDRREVYLEWHMDENQYKLEIERLSNIKSHKEAKYSENTFSLPSYICRYNSWSGFEYAILDENNYTIYYVCLLEIGDAINIVFSIDYAPQKVLKNTDLKETAINRCKFTIYQ